MKKAFLTILILAFSLSLFAADPEYSVLGSAERVITAYKRAGAAGEVPSASEFSIRILDSNSFEVVDSGNVDMPLNSRNSEFSAFSWVFSGYAYGQIRIRFTFNPMYWEEVVGNEYIPYDVTLSHTQSRIGNTQIAVGRVSGATSKIPCEFSPNFSYLFADDVSTNPTNGSVSVTNTAKTVTFTYNMSTYTKVFNGSGNTQIDNYSLNVCNYWNRYGRASVTMKITDDGKRTGNNGAAFSDGLYYANVVAEIVTQ